MLDYPIRHVAPGHGELIDDSRAEVEWLVEHRLKREAKVVAGLRSLGPSGLDALVKVVYDDVDPGLHEWAKLSMTAHLIKLEQESRATNQPESGVWQLC